MLPHDASGFRFLKLSGIYFFLTILMILNLVDLPFLDVGGSRLGFLLVGIYFWTVFRPKILTYPIVFCAGITLDFLSGGLVGLYAFCFMVMVMIVRSQRRFLLGQPWLVVWAGYCVAVVVIEAVQFIAYGMATWTFQPLIPVAFNLAISFLLYPFLLPVMLLLKRRLAD
jgi:rod shape-determining protein MreD